MILDPCSTFSLYIHFPWCVRKCPYCDFNSHGLGKQNLTETVQDQYITRLLEDFKAHAAEVKSRQLVSIFLGGGTPSLFSGKYVARLLSGLHRLHPFDANIEITLEANPGTIESTRFHEYRAAGVNRLSIGIQSFENQKLQALGRIHNNEQACKAIDTARATGFEKINLDLMFGLPNQSQEQALADLSNALSFKPTHLSWYQLTLEPRTVFYRHPPKLPNDDELFAVQEAGFDILKKAGLNRYEISAFSQLNHQCQHNRHYWEFGDYLGIGAGAHSKLSQGKVLHRFVKRKHPQHYLDHNKTFIAQQEEIKGTNKLFEFMLNALRLCEPITNDLCFARTGFQLHDVNDILDKAANKGLLQWTPQTLNLTPLGHRFLNDVTELFL